MTTAEMETNVLMNVALEFASADSRDTINKIYRQARNWARYHCYFANACEPKHCAELNNSFKIYRNEALNRIGDVDEIKRTKNVRCNHY